MRAPSLARLLLVVLVAAAAAGLPACSGAGGGGPSSSPTQFGSITAYNQSPYYFNTLTLTGPNGSVTVSGVAAGSFAPFSNIQHGSYSIVATITGRADLTALGVLDRSEQFVYM